MHKKYLKSLKMATTICIASASLNTHAVENKCLSLYAKEEISVQTLNDVLKLSTGFAGNLFNNLIGTLKGTDPNGMQAQLVEAITPLAKDKLAPILEISSLDHARVFVDGILSDVISKAGKSVGPQLKSVGITSTVIPAKITDEVLVVGDGFTGTVAQELMAIGYRPKSVDIAYAEKVVKAWNKQHPEKPITLDSNYQIKGDVRTLKDFGTDSVALVLGNDILSELQEKDISKAIKSIARILKVNGEGRLSFADPKLRSHLDLLVGETKKPKFKGSFKLEIIEGEFPSVGYLRILKTAAKINKGTDSFDDLPEIGRLALDFFAGFEKTQKATAAALRTHDVNSLFDSTFDQFMSTFIKPVLPDVMNNETMVTFLKTYFKSKIFEPLMKGDLETVTKVLNLFDGSNTEFAFLKDLPGKEFGLELITKGKELTTQQMMKTIEALQQQNPDMCLTAACTNLVNDLKNVAVGAVQKAVLDNVNANTAGSVVETFLNFSYKTGLFGSKTNSKDEGKK